ncbi:hypothetical protein ACIRQP_05460 [Streptomyces sp. NPDC102274]|uniref:hypothetical protein n=1 Tax=Streptomyces sp. NPDC102274 TaxID=3366151 RepID=UPI00380C34C6
MDTFPLVEARNQLGQLVGRVRHGHVEELEELRRLRDEADIAEAEARRAAPTGPPITHDEFMAQLDAEDAQAAAS